MSKAKLASCDADTIFKKDENIVCRKIDDETILVPIKQKVGDLESIYTLNEVGARIWELLDGKRDVKKIIETISSEYEVSAEQAEKDTIEFILQLQETKAITEK